MDSARGKKFFYTSGMGFMNDTMLIEGSAPVNVIAIRREGDSGLTFILLKPFREGKYKFIYNHSRIPSHAQADSAKKAKSKTAYQIRPAKTGEGWGPQGIQGNLAGKTP